MNIQITDFYRLFLDAARPFPATSPVRLSYQYPILTAFELTNDADSSVFLGKANRTYQVELAVLDSYQADKGNGGAENCGGRSQFEDAVRLLSIEKASI